MIYLKAMNRLKKFWIVFLSFLPIGAGAVAPWIAVGIAGLGALAGFSIYRSVAPVNMVDAMKFFSSCWSCQMFSDIISTLSGFLPRVYSGLGSAMIPIILTLVAVWMAWKLLSGYFNGTPPESPFAIGTQFTTKFVRTAIICILLVTPLPRMISDIVITPVFNVGLAVNHVITDDSNFDTCIVATALADKTSPDGGAFSPRLRHNLTCQLANVHQMTSLGMTVGWTMMGMAFNERYMHKIMWDIPIFPNVPMFFAGLLVMVLFFVALLPIPLFFLEIFVKIGMDLILLPLTLMSWLFSDWKLFPKGAHSKGMPAIVDSAVNGALGLALTGVFLTFSVMFLNAVFGTWDGVSRLQLAFEQNDSTILLDGLMMRNDSLITIVLLGVFIAMFMTMIPALIKTIFNVSVSQEFYDKAKKDINILWNGIKGYYEKITK